MEIDNPFNSGAPDTATLVVWEPLPYRTYPGVGVVGSFTYNETQITTTSIPVGVPQLQFWKTITNASYDINTNGLTDASFIFLVSFL